MTNFLSNLMIATFSAVFASVVTLLVQPLLVKRNEVGKSKTIVKKQVVNEYHTHTQLPEKEVIKEKIVVKETVKDENSSESGNELIILGAIILFLTGVFMKYEDQIVLGLLISAFSVTAMSLTMLYVIQKKGIVLDKKYKYIILWIIIGVIIVPINLYFIKNPIFYSEFKQLQYGAQSSVSGVLGSNGTNGFSALGFIVYQALGALILILYVVLQIIGNVYIAANINIESNSKGQKLWKWLDKHISVYISSPYWFIGFSVFLAIVSFLFLSGVLMTFVLK